MLNTDRIHLAQNGTVTNSCEHGNHFSGPIIREFFKHLNNYQLLKKNSDR
jgi:hypothetical protein